MDAREKLEEHKNKRIYIYIYILYTKLEIRMEKMLPELFSQLCLVNNWTDCLLNNLFIFIFCLFIFSRVSEGLSTGPFLRVVL